MINHIRTLLLNENPEDIDTDVEISWFIDPDFRKIKLSGGLLETYDILFGNEKNIPRKILKVESVMRLIRFVDLSKYLDAFDRRSTVVSEKESIASLYTNMSMFKNISVFDISKNAIAYLFTQVHDPIKNLFLQELFSIFKQTEETPLKIASAIIALAYQMDNLLPRKA